MIYLVSYGGPYNLYNKRQKFSAYTAKRFGKVDKVIMYSDKDIAKDKNFYNKNKELLSCKRGNGYWVWKPYIIYKTLQLLQKKDVLIYCDVDTIFIDNVKPVIDCMNHNKKDLLVFDTNHLEYRYTKYELFNAFDLTENKFQESRQRLSGFNIWKPTVFNIDLAKEWLYYNQKANLVNDINNYSNPHFHKEFIEHRHDQSILSLLTKKYNIESFRDPSNWGNSLLNDYPKSSYGQVIFNSLDDSRKARYLTYIFGKLYLNKFKQL